MLISSLSTIMARDLRALHREVEAYPDDASLWHTSPTIPNCAGSLVLHLAGNLQYFVGAQLGGTGYVRDRKAEFSRRDLSRAELLREVDATARVVAETFERLVDADLTAPVQVAIGPVLVNRMDMLLHLATHLTYHLGQIDYHRRAIAGIAQGVNPVSPVELASAVQSS
jgi:uncharacterized damage-inducible protein DinB